MQTPLPSYCHLGAAFIWSALVWGGKAVSGARSLEEKNIIVSIELKRDFDINQIHI